VNFAGSLLVDLKRAFPDLIITAMTRSNSSAAALASAGAISVVNDPATADYHEKIAALASKADIVINTADCEDLPVAEAILKGLKKYKEETGKVPTFIHTSGDGVFFDDTTDGTYKPNGHFYNDLNEDDIKAITTEVPHGHVDVPILKAGHEGYVNTYIVCPAAVNGVGWGPAGKASRYFKFVGATLLRHKTAFKIGEGTNVKGFVHIKDVVAFYMSLLGRILKLDGNAVEGSPYSRYYIISTDSVSSKTVVSLLAQELHKHGLLPSADVATFSFEQFGPKAGFEYRLIAANALLKPNRARQEFGWEPKHPPLIETIVEDVDVVLPSLRAT